VPAAGAAAAGAAAAAAGAAGAGAAAGAVAPVPADLLTPPWPLQAPRPLRAEVVPSLQVTPLDPELEDAAALEAVVEELGVLAGAAAVVPPWPAAFAVAVLSTPPCPLQAPRPAWDAVLPSLQIGGGAALLSVVCDKETVGSAMSAANNNRP
jgi:hypothetical protein